LKEDSLAETLRTELTARPPQLQQRCDVDDDPQRCVTSCVVGLRSHEGEGSRGPPPIGFRSCVRVVYGPIRYGRIISWSSCSTIWQCQTKSPARSLSTATSQWSPAVSWRTWAPSEARNSKRAFAVANPSPPAPPPRATIAPPAAEVKRLREGERGAMTFDGAQQGGEPARNSALVEKTPGTARDSHSDDGWNVGRACRAVARLPWTRRARLGLRARAVPSRGSRSPESEPLEHDGRRPATPDASMAAAGRGRRPANPAVTSGRTGASRSPPGRLRRTALPGARPPP